MNKYIALMAGMALVCSSVAHSESFFAIEAGIGGTAYQRTGTGVWWQEGFSHTLNMTAPAVRAGITGNIWQHGNWGIDYHVDYVWLGQVRTNAAIPTPKTNTTSGHWQGADFVDYNVENPCSGPCTNMSNFMGSGHDAGLMLTLEPHYDLRGWQLGVEAGPYIHRPSWTIDIANWYDSENGTFHPLHVTHNPTWDVSWTVGASISHGPFSLRYNYFRNGVPLTQDNPVPPGWSGAHMLTINYRMNVL